MSVKLASAHDENKVLCYVRHTLREEEPDRLFFCPHCGDAVIRAQGRIVAWHFKHKRGEGRSCGGGGPMSMEHSLVQKYMEEYKNGVLEQEYYALAFEFQTKHYKSDVLIRHDHYEVEYASPLGAPHNALKREALETYEAGDILRVDIRDEMLSPTIMAWHLNPTPDTAEALGKLIDHCTHVWQRTPYRKWALPKRQEEVAETAGRGAERARWWAKLPQRRYEKRRTAVLARRRAVHQGIRDKRAAQEKAAAEKHMQEVLRAKAEEEERKLEGERLAAAAAFAVAEQARKAEARRTKVQNKWDARRDRRERKKEKRKRRIQNKWDARQDQRSQQKWGEWLAQQKVAREKKAEKRAAEEADYEKHQEGLYAARTDTAAFLEAKAHSSETAREKGYGVCPEAFPAGSVQRYEELVKVMPRIDDYDVDERHKDKLEKHIDNLFDLYWNRRRRKTKKGLLQ